jgi:hypothetical protein
MRGLVAEVRKRLRGDPDFLTKRQRSQVVQFLQYAASLRSSDLDVVYCQTKAKQYKQEIVFADMQKLLGRKPVDEVFDPEEVAERLQKLAQSAGEVSADFEFDDAIPAELPRDRTTRFPIGLDFMDIYMGGGPARQNLITLMGPYGSAKTTIAVAATAQQCIYWQTEWQKSQQADPLNLVFYFSYEEPLPSLQLRVMANVAQIPRQRLEGKAFSDLSTADRLESYEREIFAPQLRTGVPVGGEQDRYRHWRQMLNHNLVWCDMTGNDPKNPNAGKGLVREMRDVIQRRLLQYERVHGRPAQVGCVVVDYANAAVVRYMEAKGIPPEQIRFYAGRFGLNFKNHVLVPFDCFGLVVNQLNPSSNQKAPGVAAHHTDASEARNFAENADYSFQVSALTENELGTIRCSKQRGAARRPDRVIQLAGEFGRITDADDRWAIEPRTQRIIQRNEMESLHDGSGPSPGGPQFRTTGGLPIGGASRRVSRVRDEQ